MIQLRAATKRYGSGESVVDALHSVDLEIEAGEFVAIMGPSGCGKSTLLHILGGLDRLSSGDAVLDGRPLHEMGDRELTLLRRDRLGFVFQFFNLLPTLTVEENVCLPALLAGRDEQPIAARARELLNEVSLSHRARHYPHQLSGGEMQRAALSRALLLEPPVLLADEPTGNLDSHASEDVVALFQRLGREHGTTIVMVTHSREVAGAAQRLIEMRDGRILSDASAA